MQLMKHVMAVALGALLTGGLWADPQGDSWARKSFDLKDARDSSALMTMSLVDKQGAKKIRKLEHSSRELPDGTKQDFMKFLEPADVVGTKLLSSKPKGGTTEQSLWLPALGKVRKISAAGKDGDFVNSDFSYYDLEEREFSDHTYTLLADNETLPDPALAGMTFAKVEFVPVDKTSPYAKTVVWINRQDFYPYRIDAYDKKDGLLLKTMTALRVESFDGVLVATETLAVHAKRGSKTTFKVDQLKVNQGVKADLFTQKNLEK